MSNRQYQYAEFTQTLYDTLIDEPDLLDMFVLDTTEHTNKFKEIFTAQWNTYEIGAETITMFKFNLTNVFNANKDYFIELLKAYETKINMLDGELRTIDTEDNFNEKKTGNSNSNESVTISTQGENQHIDLPRVKVSEERPSVIEKNNDKGTNTITSTNDDSYSKDNTGTRKIISKGGVNVIELKKQYMNLLRNVYLEFSMKFEKCFLTLFA